MKLVIHTDGGSRGNPGPAALGVHIADAKGKTVLEHGRYLGEATNNIAEWSAVLDAFDHAEQLGATEVEIVMDSELVVRQWNGQYRVKNAGLLPIFLEARKKSAKFKTVAFRHVRREYNVEADRLANEAIDREMLKRRPK